MTIPSQIRYVHYFEVALKNKWILSNFTEPSLYIHSIKLFTIPNFNVFGGCGNYFLKRNILFKYKRTLFYYLQ